MQYKYDQAHGVAYKRIEENEIVYENATVQGDVW